MFFLPYRLDASSGQIPFLTILICLLCSLVYWQQYSIDNKYYQAVEKFCFYQLSKRETAWLDRVHANAPGNSCVVVLESIRESEDPAVEIERLAAAAKPIKLFANKADNLRYVEKRVQEIFYKFDRDVPQHLTSDLAYDPASLNLVKMVTSTFSHGSWDHLLGNLLFFYIFAASVEIVFGAWVYGLFIGAVTLVTSLSYSYAMSGVENALPTVGLSGVVMAAVAALAVMMPEVRIRCFFWFFVIFRIFRIPALFLATWYIGWDVYSIYQVGNDSPVNYVAHVSGAAAGALFGLYYRVFRQGRLDEIRV
jgi:membrane associated rhomboid family serine protease